ncbi:thiamine pyrophosphate-binding protein [Ferruginivarius sediminum]|uniref:Thiamine pyrophosphate-binding protein n=1 Tax=Ferruginivarius sediminum TaxID=2661937 RepID=A0A369THK7_9PROT|nr:thiamine pyrophosphate-binding protein [Ferruginivarius sediminum]RDD63607.1 thiamine pyrophosphate-binding protein [Ferruginivarius sediminum]
MAQANGPRTGGQILIDQLRIHGADRAFCVPGESYLAALDALHDAPEIALTVCRQEGGAAMMADAYGKLTGKPGICFVTRGPGATNASSGVHVAFQDSTPMILFIGQVGRGMRDREAFQEIDYRRMYGQLAKWVAEIDDPARIPEYVSRAFHTAMAGRPGPVVLALPEDVLTESTVVADVPACRPVRAYPGAGEMAELRERLSRAKRPFVLLGGGGWSQQAKADMEAFAQANDLPVGCSFRCQDYFDNAHGCYAGDVGIAPNPKLAERVREADLLLVVGARLGEMTTAGYTLVQPPVPRQTLVHVHPGAEELGRVYQPALAIQAATPAFAAAVREMPPINHPAWAGEAARAHADYLDWSTPQPVPGPVQMAEVMAWLRERLPAEAVVCNGAGNYAGFVHRYHRYRAYRSQLAPTSGSMGYGVPAAVAAKLTRPDRPVVAFAGDGCFLMTGQELATAVHHGAAIVVIVVNNSMYGTIRMHQEREYPGRISGTGLTNPDFAALAHAYGAHGEVVETTEAFAPAFERALESGKPAVLELRIDPEAISTTRTLGDIREAALAKARQA